MAMQAQVPPPPPVAANTRNAAAKQQQQAAANAGAAAPPAGDGDDRKAADGDQPAAPPQAGANDGAAAAVDDRDTLANMMQEMRFLREKVARLEQGLQPAPQSPLPEAYASPPSRAHQPRDSAQSVATRVAALIRTPAVSVQQPAAMQSAAGISFAQLLTLQSLGSLPSFSGKGADTTLTAHEWLRRADKFFAVREDALGLTPAQGDQSRLVGAANALTDNAARWYNALPHQPSDWTAFVVAVKEIGRAHV